MEVEGQSFFCLYCPLGDSVFAISIVGYSSCYIGADAGSFLQLVCNHVISFLGADYLFVALWEGDVADDGIEICPIIYLDSIPIMDF